MSVKIHRTPTRGCDSFTLSYWQDGVRKRPTFNTFDKALKEAKVVAPKLGSASGDVLTLTSADRAADADKWFAVTPEAMDVSQKTKEQNPTNIAALAVISAA